MSLKSETRLWNLRHVTEIRDTWCLWFQRQWIGGGGCIWFQRQCGEVRVSLISEAVKGGDGCLWFLRHHTPMHYTLCSVPLCSTPMHQCLCIMLPCTMPHVHEAWCTGSWCTGSCQEEFVWNKAPLVNHLNYQICCQMFCLFVYIFKY